jgi:outer membrane protein assembly factor BamB
MAHGGKLWVADNSLQRFDVLPAGGSLKASWSGFEGDSFEGPPQIAGENIFCVRRAAGKPGMVAASLKTAGGEPIWETAIAQPVVALTISGDGKSATVVSATGAKVSVDLAGFQGASAVHFAPLVLESKPLPPVQASIELPSGGRVIVPSGQPAEVFVIDSDGKAPRRLALPAPLAATPIVWSEGLLCIGSSGSVVLLNPATGEPLAESFQMGVKAGSILENCVATAAEKDVAIISDGQHSLYSLRLEKEPQPHLVQAASARLAAPIISSPAILEKSVLVVDKSGNVRTFQLANLKEEKVTKLACSAVLFGPARAGKAILLATDRGELVCLDASGKQLWKVPVADSPLVGPPLPAGGDYLVASTRGTLVRISGKSGEEIARTQLGLPLAGPPVLVGEFLLIPTAAGGLLKVAVPVKEQKP